MHRLPPHSEPHKGELLRDVPPRLKQIVEEQRIYRSSWPFESLKMENAKWQSAKMPPPPLSALSALFAHGNGMLDSFGQNQDFVALTSLLIRSRNCS